jgi:hypothetical protein
MAMLRVLIVLLAVIVQAAAAADKPPQQQSDEEWLEEEQERAKGDHASALLKRQVPQVSFDQVAWVDAVDFMRDVTGATLYLDHAAFSDANIDLSQVVITLKTKGDSLDKVLKAIAGQMGEEGNRGTAAACGAVIVITTEKGLRPFITRHRATLELAKTPEGAALAKPVEEAAFRDVSLADAISFLRDVTSTNIFPDWKSLEAAGVTKRTAVSVTARKLPLGQVLQLIADDCSTKSRVRVGMKDGGIRIDAAPPPKGAAAEPKPEPADKDGL